MSFDFVPTYAQLRENPELASIFMLENAINTAYAALTAAHPYLSTYPSGSIIADVRLQAASNLVLMAKTLKIFVEHYQNVTIAQSSRDEAA